MVRPSSLLDTRIIYCGDCLDQLRQLPDDSIDLCYIDPPFNSNRNYEVFWGETKEKRAFDDRHESTRAYIEYMRPRCVEISRVLKKTGCFYYHCDWHASHYVKVMLDQIFGGRSFINEIIWKRQSAHNDAKQGSKHLGRVHDSLFLYNGGGLDYYLEGKDVPLGSIWDDISPVQGQGAEGLGYPTQKPLKLLERILEISSKPNDIVLDAFCGCGTTLVSAQRMERQWIGIDISPTACRVMAKRLRDVARLSENETLWRSGRGFVVRDLPQSERQLRRIPPFEFENWAVIALGGIANKVQVGDMGLDGRLYPISSAPTTKPDSLDFMDVWYPIQVKQKDKAGRPDIDAFEAAMIRAERMKGFFVSFDYTGDALAEIQRFFKQTGRVIVALTVR